MFSISGCVPLSLFLVLCLLAIKHYCRELLQEAAVDKVVHQVHLSARHVTDAVLRTSRLCC